MIVYTHDRWRFPLPGHHRFPIDKYTLLRDSRPVSWQALAKDGADLPAALAVRGPAVVVVSVGETSDVTFTPVDTGTYRLTAGLPGLPPTWSQEILVR